MLAENLRCKADCLIRIKCSIGIYIQCKLVEVSYLTNSCILYDHVDSVYRCVDRIHCDHTDRHVIGFAFVCTDIATSLGNGKLHGQSAVFSTVQGCNHLIRVHDLNILICLDISCCNNTFALTLDVCGLRLIVTAVILNGKRFQIHDDFGHIFLHARNGAEFMKYTIDLHLAYCSSRKGGQHNSS